MSIIDGRVFLVLLTLLVALACGARLVYLSSRRIAAAEHVDHLATEPPPAPVQLGGRFRFTCRICRLPAVVAYANPAEYLDVLTDPTKRQTCDRCRTTLADLETRATS